MRNRPAGGSATAGGMNFQYRVTAWIAAHILAENDASPLWNLPVDTTLEWFRCETEQPVDDLMVGTLSGGIIFCQIKHALQLSQSADSDLASTLDQFVRQFIAYRTTLTGTRPWEHPLDPARDRLVIVTGPRSSKPIKEHLPTVLQRIHGLVRGQCIEDAAVNAEEKRTLSVIIDHIKSSWKAALGQDPSGEDIRHLLSLIHIQVLDVDDRGAAEREAKDRLRSVVLVEHEKTDAAWHLLINLCARFAQERSGANRIGIQRALLDNGIALRAVRSYRADIERLTCYSQTITNILADFARIQVGTTEVKIRRRSTEELRRIADENSLLIIGEPGAGKSGALHDLAQMLVEDGRDVVCLAVDRLAARSLGEIREELGLEHDLVDVLDNWPGTQPAFLVIDALDAARADPAAKAIRDIIRMVVEQNSRWRVVASVRKFDLRYSMELQRFFVGNPSEKFHDNEFLNIRHINIPKFTDEELDYIGGQSPAIHGILSKASKELRELLRVPFNLRLIAELLGEGVGFEDLTPIETQIELLNRYWTYRIIRSDGQGDARETVLRRTCNEMVKARTLHIDRLSVADSAFSGPLNDLLSTQILSEWQPSPGGTPDRYVLTFAHHMLFDYAVARLLLRGTFQSLIDRLVLDPELVLIIRPSLILHFQHLWMDDASRKGFWDLTIRIIREDKIPEVGKLIAPSVAAELANELSDLEPLCASLETCDTGVQSAAEQSLRHLIGALLAADPSRLPLAGQNAGPWCSLLERISHNLRTPVAYTVRSLLSTLCEHTETFTHEQRASAGVSARRLLEFAWKHDPRDQWLVIHAIQAVCRTFESEPVASTTLLHRCLESNHLKEHGFEEMPWLARETKRLISLDPAFVGDIYRAAFTHQEQSQDPTPMGQSRILPLISNRRQDYQMALYELAKVFPEFLAQDLKRGTIALIAVMEGYVNQRHPATSGEMIEESFDFNGITARIRTDYSVIWDEGNVYRHDDPLKMLDSFEQHLELLAGQEENTGKFHDVVEILVQGNRLAVIWRRLLFLGARFPNTLGKEILPLAWAMPILTSYDTHQPAGEFIKAVFSLLAPVERERIELTILSIPDVVLGSRREAGEHIRNLLLGCLTHADLVTTQARHLLKNLQAANAIPLNEPPVKFTGVESRPYGEVEYLSDEGVPVDAEPNQRVREFERPVKEFADRYLNSVPTLEEVVAIFPALQILGEALSNSEVDGVHPKQCDYAWGILTAACARAARCDELSCEEGAGAFVKEILLRASLHPNPVHHPDSDAQFDECPSWGSPSARIEAAEGLIVLARNTTCATDEVLHAIEQLSNDPVPSVRYQVARQLNTLYQTNPKRMWGMINRLCREEKSRGVLQGLLSGPFSRIANVHPDRIAVLTKEVFDRVSEGPGARKVRDLCVDIFTSLYIWRDHAKCRENIFQIIEDTFVNPDDVHQILCHIRNPLTHGPVYPCDPVQDGIRQRAFELLATLLRLAHDGLRSIEKENRNTPSNVWSEADQEKAKSLVRLIDGIGNEIYFASGAFDSKKQTGSGQKRSSMNEKMERFYKEAASILIELADVGIPSLTHHLLETLEIFIPLDPPGVFLRIGRVIRAGQQGGYQYESLAADMMVRLVERYLAEYRTVLRENDECRRTLLEVLDIFVQAGWPSARRLTYRLEEIFR